MNDSDDTAASFARAAAQRASEEVELTLFIAGMGPRSTQAVADVESLCKEMGDRCSVEIVDIYERPAAAMEAQVVAVPALVRQRPLPYRKLIGTIGSPRNVARRLDLYMQTAGDAA